MGTGPVELRIYNGGSRWLLQPYAVVELWAGAALLGTISGRAVTLIVEHHLATAALAGAVRAELEGAPEQPGPVRKPLQPMLAEDLRALRRARRRTRRKDAP